MTLNKRKQSTMRNKRRRSRSRLTKVKRKSKTFTRRQRVSRKRLSRLRGGAASEALNELVLSKQPDVNGVDKISPDDLTEDSKKRCLYTLGMKIDDSDCKHEGVNKSNPSAQCKIVGPGHKMGQGVLCNTASGFQINNEKKLNFSIKIVTKDNYEKELNNWNSLLAKEKTNKAQLENFKEYIIRILPNDGQHNRLKYAVLYEKFIFPYGKKMSNLGQKCNDVDTRAEEIRKFLNTHGFQYGSDEDFEKQKALIKENLVMTVDKCKLANLELLLVSTESEA